MKTSGILLIDKPIGITSNQVVSIAKKRLNIKKIGHSGTLDPFASGLMILLVGKATKFQSYLMNRDKTYEVGFIFGEETDTLDPTGRVVKKSSYVPTLQEVKQIIQTDFLGTIELIPPIYSAVHIDGRRAYELARKGENFTIPTRKVIIHSFKVNSYSPPELFCEIKCSKGTYIRSIARDLALKLNTFGHAFCLRRIENGDFHVEQSISPTEIGLQYLISITDILKNISSEVNRIEIDSKSVDLLEKGDYLHLAKRFKKKLNGLYVNGECIAIIVYIEGKFKMIYYH